MDQMDEVVDSTEFYREIEEEYGVELRRTIPKSWEEYWAWSVQSLFHQLFGLFLLRKILYSNVLIHLPKGFVFSIIVACRFLASEIAIKKKNASKRYWFLQQFYFADCSGRA